MANQKKATDRSQPIMPRESDDPIAEEFREELLQRPSFSAQSVGRLISDEDKLARMDGLMAEMLQRIEALEKRIQILEIEGKR